MKVLVVDDSALMRRVLSDKINLENGMRVIGIAHNGKDAIDKVKQLDPDIITMDIEMPVMDGITAVKEITKFSKVPIVVVSALSVSGSKMTMDAMNAGAVDFIVKPSMSIIDDGSFQDELIQKIKNAIKAKVVKFQISSAKSRSFNPSTKKILLIASSTGGPQTLEALLTELPKNIPVPILIVQHMPPLFTKSLADRLNKICEIEVREAIEGDKLEDGVALIAPGNYHMEVAEANDASGLKIHLNQNERLLGVRPCANILFKSVAPIYKENTVGVVLTGMGSDGTEGSKKIKEYNGTVIVQSEATSIIYGMPKSVADSGCADMVIDLDKMAVGILQVLEI